jgi:hypothetical protein
MTSHLSRESVFESKLDGGNVICRYVQSIFAVRKRRVRAVDSLEIGGTKQKSRPAMTLHASFHFKAPRIIPQLSHGIFLSIGIYSRNHFHIIRGSRPFREDQDVVEVIRR